MKHALILGLGTLNEFVKHVLAAVNSTGPDAG